MENNIETKNKELIDRCSFVPFGEVKNRCIRCNYISWADKNKSHDDIIEEMIKAGYDMPECYICVTKDGKVLKTGDVFYSIISDTKMSSSGRQKFFPIELIYPNDWHLSNNGQIAYYNKQECLNECNQRNFLELNY